MSPSPDPGVKMVGKGQDMFVQSPPPQKPPRSMMLSPTSQPTAVVSYGKEVSQAVSVTSQAVSVTGQDTTVNVTKDSATAVVTVSAAPVVPKLATFAAASVEANSRGVLSPPTSTSTPKPQTHVTFSAAVTEITESSPQSTSPDNAGGKRKVPPPPPPRRSSRPPGKASPTEMSPPTSPSHRLAVKSGPPHTYENIENLKINSQKTEGNGTGPQSKTIRPKSASDLPSPPPAPPGTQGSKTLPTKIRQPMNRYQHELAAGIYSNMNRPDLQAQKVKAADIVHSAVTVDNKDGGSDSGSSSTSLDSQQGTVKRAAGRKVPPPPPARKTSSLSAADMKSLSPSGDTVGSHGNSVPPKMPAQYNTLPHVHKDSSKANTAEPGKKPLANGHVTSKTLPVAKTAPNGSKVLPNGNKGAPNGNKGAPNGNKGAPNGNKGVKMGPNVNKASKGFEETEIY